MIRRSFVEWLKILQLKQLLINSTDSPTLLYYYELTLDKHLGIKPIGIYKNVYQYSRDMIEQIKKKFAYVPGILAEVQKDVSPKDSTLLSTLFNNKYKIMKPTDYEKS